MKKNLNSLRATAAAVAGAGLVLACGGGGGDDAAAPAPPPAVASEVPPSAQQSAAGAFTFVAGLAQSKDDTAEPLVVGDATLATSETDEPDPGV